MVRNMKDNTKATGMGGAIRQELRREGEHLKRGAQRLANRTKGTLVTAEKKVKRYVKKNPEKAAIIAAGIGAAAVATGAALVRRRKKK